MNHNWNVLNCVWNSKITNEDLQKVICGREDFQMDFMSMVLEFNYKWNYECHSRITWHNDLQILKLLMKAFIKNSLPELIFWILCPRIWCMCLKSFVLHSKYFVWIINGIIWIIWITKMETHVPTFLKSTSQSNLNRLGNCPFFHIF